MDRNSYRDNLNFGRDCAEIMCTLIGILSQGKFAAVFHINEARSPEVAHAMLHKLAARRSGKPLPLERHENSEQIKQGGS